MNRFLMSVVLFSTTAACAFAIWYAAYLSRHVQEVSLYHVIVNESQDVFVCLNASELKNRIPGSSRAILFGDVFLRNSDISFLEKDERIEVISATGPAASGEAVAGYARTPNLRSLKLWRTGFSIKKLAPLHQYKKLEELILSGPDLTDEVLADIAKIETLRLILISEHQVTDRGFDEVERAHPKLKIELLSR